jgi:hypothetical protein
MVVVARNANKENRHADPCRVYGGNVGVPYCGCQLCRSQVGVRIMSAHINAEEGIHGIRSICFNPWRGCDRDIGRTPQPTNAGRTSANAASRRHRHGCLICRRIAAARHRLRDDHRADGQPSLAKLCARDRKPLRVPGRNGRSG